MTTLNWTIFLSLLLLSSCQLSGGHGSKVNQPHSTFIESVQPKPNKTVSLEDYRAGYIFGFLDEKGTFEFYQLNNAICVLPIAARVFEENDTNIELEDFLKRSSLYVNGSKWRESEPRIVDSMLGLIENLETGASKAVGPFTICWEVELEPGDYDIEYLISKSSGEVLTFSWSFSITNES